MERFEEGTGLFILGVEARCAIVHATEPHSRERSRVAVRGSTAVRIQSATTKAALDVRKNA